jgi:pyruvate dehydrogenase E2 component (dihydrolipoamide acetyltransferase)
MTQGNVGAWQKAVGDKLSPGEPLVEIETDKATMDFEFQEEGYLAKILLETGSKDIPVGKPLAVYVEEESDVSAFAEFSAEDAAGADKSSSEGAAVEETQPSQEAKPAETQTKSESKPADKKSSEPIDGGRIFASPAAKTIALEKGINLNEIKGTGPEGRIIKRDVENYKPAPAASAAKPVAAAAGTTSSYEDIPISAMRKTIATRLRESKSINPDYIVSSTVSVSKLLKLRASLNAGADGEFKISVNDILVKAISVANRAVPQANSAWLEKEGVIRP